MVSVTAREVGLPDCYDAVDVERCDEVLSVDCEVARWLAAQEEVRGYRPTALFTRLAEYSQANVLGNPYPRPVLLAALGTGPDWQRAMSARLAGPPPAVRRGAGHWRELSGLDALPALRHRPGDAGRYVTAGVGVTRGPDGTTPNLGVYRIQVADSRRGRIFLDPRTDGYRNWERSVATGCPLPISIFIGANPVFMLVAASRLPMEVSDYDFAARLLRREVTLALEPSVPVDSHYVILGEVSSELEEEGPFAEFKGYYVPSRLSPVLTVRAVLARSEPIYPTIVTGAESGLTLMAMQNEYLLFCHLIERGIPVRSVNYILEARGEFVALIDCDAGFQEAMKDALEFDKRVKIVFAGPQLCSGSSRGLWQTVATFGFTGQLETYVRKGRQEGNRIGIAFDRPPEGWAVEY